MKAIVIIKLAFLLTIVPDVVRTYTLVPNLNYKASKGKKIHGRFQPLVDGYMGPTQLGILFKVRFDRLDQTVAMKFTPRENRTSSLQEYTAYTHLGAIDKPDAGTHSNTNDQPNAERFGIPTIYYYDELNELDRQIILAMTLLESTEEPIYKVAEIQEKDLFVVFREFVKIMKYVHSRGVIHGDPKVQNMIIRNGQGYIMNFALSDIMEDGKSTQNMRSAKYDFLGFLNSLYELKSTWPIFGITQQDVLGQFHYKPNIFGVVSRRNAQNGCTGVRRVFTEFAKQALDHETAFVENSNGNRISFYDHLYNVVNEEMRNSGLATPSNPSLFHISDPTYESDQWDHSYVDQYYFPRFHP